MKNDASYSRQFVKKFPTCSRAIVQNDSSRMRPCYGAVLHPRFAGWQTRSVLTVVKPSPLRFWGFLLTVLGGGLLAFGSIGSWAVVSLGNSVENAIPTKGVDVWQGKATLGLGLLIVVAILGLRVVRAERRRTVAIGIIVLGMLALTLAVWSAVSLGSVAGDTGIETMRKIAEQTGMSTARASRFVAQLLDRFGIHVRAQSGLWVTIVGAVLAVAGGVVDLLWVRRKAELGDAIDPDTGATSTG